MSAWEVLTSSMTPASPSASSFSAILQWVAVCPPISQPAASSRRRSCQVMKGFSTTPSVRVRTAAVPPREAAPMPSVMGKQVAVMPSSSRSGKATSSVSSQPLSKCRATERAGSSASPASQSAILDVETTDQPLPTR